VVPYGSIFLGKTKFVKHTLFDAVFDADFEYAIGFALKSSYCMANPEILSDFFTLLPDFTVKSRNVLIFSLIKQNLKK